MQILILKTQIKAKTIYSESEELIIGILAYFLHFKMAITHGENDFTEISENLARFENNFDY